MSQECVKGGFFPFRVNRSPCIFSPAYGGIGGGPFEDPCSSVAQIRQIRIGLGSYYDATIIRSIQVLYKYNSGRLVWGPKHGTGHPAHNFYFANGEVIIAAVGRADGLRLRQLAFLTRTSDGDRYVKGPVGCDTCGSSFIVNQDIFSIYGRKGADIDSIGFQFR